MSGQFLILSPEPPYPLQSGGAYRTASLVHYFSRIGDVDLILLSDSGNAALMPPGLVRSQKVIALSKHSRSLAARYVRNARRALRGVPPLIDRLSGLGDQIVQAIGNRKYDVGLLEHFWCAPYVNEVKAACRASILDLHNIESSLHASCALTDSGLQAAGHRRFAHSCRNLEATLMPQFDLVLATSESDARTAQAIAPAARTAIYRNGLPTVPVPDVSEDVDLVAFAGNFEYHPNVDAVGYLASEVWPLVRKQHPAARVRLVGRGDNFVRHLIPVGSGIETTGCVIDAFSQIAQAAVSIAPLRAGSGTRIKILEAWAAARPVVATSLAAEGLEAQDGKNIMLADTPVAFSRAVLKLLADRELRTRMGAAGRATFERLYTWEAVWNGMDQHLPGLYPLRPRGYTE